MAIMLVFIGAITSFGRLRLRPGEAALECPNGVVRKFSAKGNMIFGAACKGCPVRDLCTKTKKGRKVVITEHHGRQRAHRAAAKDAGFHNDYRVHRPLIERSIAWLVAGGNRRLRSRRGTTKNHVWLQTRLSGLNLRRLLKLGLTRRDGDWILA